ncbi:hypothetical protein [Desulfolutivibrio sulfoxidireducens]|uniref:hypothetical protein n=1 Tax=Desulfolutivibrio sulfoxidireducens TaxID=2773299 RepID=UPI00159D21A1|nr:hypothetical protein [Desulfolutivibrio sulfoxidireducens]QLA17719.1 hypothetical protein GD605_17355 [Desulfolutivibrio sulfoxidireducens]QLA21293.1 hypothetical protein GD604_16965 [Desulfolutivibrio sulfoxidireducens]
MPLRQVLLLLALTAMSCTPGSAAGPMTISDFRGFCTVFPTPNSCDSGPICDEFAYVLEDTIQSLDDCLARCRRVKAHLTPGNITNNCAKPLNRASDLCAQYCRRAFAQ